jgi:hypothetical protein
VKKITTKQVALYTMLVIPNVAQADRLVPLAENIEVEVWDTPVEFPSIQARGFDTFSILGVGGVCDFGFPGASGGSITISWRFLEKPGVYSSPIAKTGGGSCGIDEETTNCGNTPISGPHIAIRLEATSPDSECIGGGCFCTIDKLLTYIKN